MRSSRFAANAPPCPLRGTSPKGAARLKPAAFSAAAQPLHLTLTEYRHLEQWQGLSLRRFQQLTSVAFGATSFPRKEANHQPLRGSKTSDRISGFTAVGILMTLPHNVISSGGSTLCEHTVKNRYSFDESRDLSD